MVESQQSITQLLRAAHNSCRFEKRMLMQFLISNVRQYLALLRSHVTRSECHHDCKVNPATPCGMIKSLSTSKSNSLREISRLSAFPPFRLSPEASVKVSRTKPTYKHTKRQVQRPHSIYGTLGRGFDVALRTIAKLRLVHLISLMTKQIQQLESANDVISLPHQHSLELIRASKGQMDPCHFAMP